MEKIKKQFRKNNSGKFFVYYNDDDYKVSSRTFLADSSIDLLITDPPYGINGDKLHVHYNRNDSFVLKDYIEIPLKEYQGFSNEWISEAKRVLRPGGSAYIFSGWTNLHHILNAVNKSNLIIRNHIIWKYNFGVFTRQKFTTSHYHILYVAVPGEKPTFNTYSRYSPSERNEKNGSVLYADMEDVWKIDREYKTNKRRHKNELPTKLLTKIIQYSSNEGDVIADFFAGSFSTAKVAKGLNRNSICFEISKEACEFQKPHVESVQWGELLDKVPTGKDDRPKNQYKAWDNQDLDKLVELYHKYRQDNLTKQDAIKYLRTDFDRGYFSVLNALKKRGL